MNTEPKKRTKKGRGRPVTYVVPQRIDASPEQIAEVVLRAKPKEHWRYPNESENTSQG